MGGYEMGQFLTCIVTKEGRVLFCEWMDHEALKERLELPDGNFVRIESTATWGYVIEDDPIPGWYKRIHNIMRLEVDELVRTIRPIRKKFLKVADPVRDTFLKDYRVAYGAFLNICSEYMAECTDGSEISRECYRGNVMPAMRELSRVEGEATIDFDLATTPAVREYIKELSKVEGYVPLKRMTEGETIKRVER